MHTQSGVRLQLEIDAPHDRYARGALVRLGVGAHERLVAQARAQDPTARGWKRSRRTRLRLAADALVATVRTTAASLLDDQLVQAIATIMERRIAARGVEKVGERKDLEPATIAVLGEAFPDRVDKERKVAIPDWERVGNVDVIVRREPGSSAVSALIELKWAGPGDDILYEAIFDLFKLALAAQREDRPRTYLLTGAAKAHWDGSGFADLFSDGEHDPVELSQRRLQDKHQTLAWDDLLRGARDSYPQVLPQGIKTEVAGRAGIGDWELRAVEVRVSNQAFVPLGDGWPWGERPAEAKHPLPTAAGEFQVDPATLPETSS